MAPSLTAAIGVFIAAATLLTTWIVLAARHGGKVSAMRRGLETRMDKLETEMSYIRRDLDQILKLYRLVPASEQDQRRRR